MSDAAESGVKSLGIFSTLQSATESKFFFLAMSFILLIDNVFVHFKQSSLFDLATHENLMSKSNVGIQVILIFVIFSFLTSLIFKVALAITLWIYDQAVLRAKYLIEDISNSTSYRGIREHHCVKRHELYIEAHKTKDPYLLKLYEQRFISDQETQSQSLQSALFSFFCLAMFIWNLLEGTFENQDLSAMLFKLTDSSIPTIIVIFLLFFLFVFYLHQIVSMNRKDNWVYCPTLSETLAERHKKRKEDQRI